MKYTETEWQAIQDEREGIWADKGIVETAIRRNAWEPEVAEDLWKGVQESWCYTETALLKAMFEATPNLAAYELRGPGGGALTQHGYITAFFGPSADHGFPITGSPPITTPYVLATGDPAFVATPFEALFESFAAAETPTS